MKTNWRQTKLTLLLGLLTLSGLTAYAYRASAAWRGHTTAPAGQPATILSHPHGRNAANPSAAMITLTSAAAVTHSDVLLTTEDAEPRAELEPVQSGGSYNITQSVIPGGGGTSANGATNVVGSVGQSVAAASSGGSYSLSGGFWSSDACPTITVNPPTLPNGQIAQPYSQQLTQTGGAGTITWSVSAGALPNNVTLNATTGLLSGTPTASGTFNFTITATDANACPGARSYTVGIQPSVSCPTVSNISPTSGAVGSSVTITGTGLTGVTAVKFASNVAAQFTLNSETQITATVPPGAVTGPITLSNPSCSDAQTSTFTVTLNNCIPVSIATNLTGSSGSSLMVPITAGNTTGRGVTAYDFVLSFDPAVIKLSSVPTDQTGTLSSSLSITANTSVAGTLTLSAFGTTPLTGAGTLLNLKFDVIGTANACSDLVWVSFTFNEGTPCATTSNGKVCLAGGSISGTVNYGTATTPKAVPGVTLTAAGSPSATNTTDTSGNYSLTNLGGGPYTVTPTKTGAVNGISSFDASLVAQHAAGLITLTPNQQIAADASGNGTISSFDASLIAQTAAGIASTGIAGTWKFVPANRSYPSLSGNQTGQNFDAILVGDVSGNWTPPAGSSAPVTSPVTSAAAKVAPAALSDRVIAVSFAERAFTPGSLLRLPIVVGDLTGLGVTAYDFDLLYDPSVLRLQAVAVDTVGSLSQAMSLTTNTATPGRLRVAAFGTEALGGSGTLVSLNFEVIGEARGFSPLAWRRFEFNEGEPAKALLNTSAPARLLANVSAASFSHEDLAREALVTAFGVGLATTTQAAETLPLPTTLAGTRVVVRDSTGVERLAPLFFVSPEQVNYQIPAGTATGVAWVTITNSEGLVAGELVEISETAPGLFAANADGQGAAAAVVVRVRADGSQRFEPVSQFDAAQQRFITTPIDLGPASEQVFLMLYGTGLRFHRGLAAVSVKIGGVEAPVTYVGPAPGFAGLDQVNALVPRSVRGEVEIVLTVEGKVANTVRIHLN